MKYLSVCSGIEAATVAWHPLGWEAAAFSEIEPFPSAVLAHHYPNVPNLGDMTKFKEWELGTNIDVFVGGTPCQSFSVAGLRKGLDDPRGNLMLTYLAIADKFRPKWLVWENVPGVLSSNDGKDFGTFLGGLGELGYGFAYRILDAQYFGVAQRRRRIFVVGYIGDWRPAAAVLFERDSLQRNPPPSRKKRERASAFFESSLAQYRAADVGGTLKASGGVLGGGSETFLAQRVGSGDRGGMISAYSIREDAQANTFSATELEVATALKALQPSVQSHHAQTFIAQMDCYPISTQNALGRENGIDDWPLGLYKDGDPSPTLTKSHGHAVALSPKVYSFDSVESNSMKSSNPDSGCREVDLSKTLDTTQPNPAKGQGGIGILQPVAFRETADCLTASYGKNWNGNGGADNGSLFAFSHIDNGRDATDGLSPTLRTGGQANGMMSVQSSMAVRRLTPIECERLQGFCDNYTNIAWNNKPESPDGPRYKALGNSMAVPVMRWIGERINQYEQQNNSIGA